MDKVTTNITKWNLLFDNYLENEKICYDLLEHINNAKNNVNKLLGNHRNNDDTLFCNSIISNSLFYLSNSLKIIKIKFIKDINNILLSLNSNKKITELNKINFLFVINQYKNITDELNKHTTTNNMSWIKNCKSEDIFDIEHELDEALKYHLKLIKFFMTQIELEKTFYCN
jgi:hypothetical protein